MTQHLPPLPSAYLAILTALDRVGGAGRFERGIVYGGTPEGPITGDNVGLNTLVVYGLLVGERGLFILTPEGRQLAAEIASKSVRTASQL
jgi:hypothetical protein